MTQGVLYKATGEEYIKEAKFSAKSVKNSSRGLKTAIITDENVNSDYFDLIIEPAKSLNNDNSSNILYPDTSPFDKTIYLDTDTYVCQDISHLTNLLDDFNLGITMATSRHKIPERNDPICGFSGGILVFDSSRITTEFHKLWHDLYWEYRENKDVYRNQPSLSSAVVESGIRFYTLSEEYNTFINLGSDVGRLYREVQILHGRPQTLAPKMARELNKRTGLRVFHVTPSLLNNPKVKLIHPSEHHIARKIYRSLLINGVRETVRKSMKKLF